MVLFVGGRELTQSWTSNETFGLLVKFVVFLERGSEVMIIVGPDGRAEPSGKELGGRYEKC